AGDTFNVQSFLLVGPGPTQSNVPAPQWFLNGGPGSDLFNLGASNNTLASIAGNLHLDGGGGLNNLVLLDQGSKAASNYVIQTTLMISGRAGFGSTLNLDDAVAPGAHLYTVTHPVGQTAYQLQRSGVGTIAFVAILQVTLGVSSTQVAAGNTISVEAVQPGTK